MSQMLQPLLGEQSEEEEGRFYNPNSGSAISERLQKLQ